MSEQYDYIVVGGGSAGCVVASRLVREFDARVLLLEAGGNDDSPLVSMPAGSFKMIFGGGEFVRTHQSIPQPALGGRAVSIHQANLLGGGSSVNVMVYTRGSREDYGRWDDICGKAGWDWNDILPYFMKHEGNQRFHNATHNGDGPLKVSEQPYVAEGSHYFVRTMQRLGVPFASDFNSGTLYGVGYQQATLNAGKRCNAARAFIDPIRSDPRLKISFRSKATKILIENGRAIGVEFKDKSGVKHAFAKREVILTAGALVTPKLLMLSGIGPAQQLKNHNIPVVSDLPGVGQNLQDHAGVMVVGSTRGAFGYHLQSSGWRMVRNAIQYALFRSGPVSSTGSEAVAFANIGKDSEEPDFQIYSLQMMWPGLVDKEDHGVTLMANLLRPKSRGSITIASANPDDDPLIDFNWMSDPEDRRLFLKAFRYIRNILKTNPLAAIIAKEAAPGANVDTDEDIAEYLRNTVTTNYHPCGTARMGRADDELAVLTPDLRVRGVDGLRVMDASSFPTIISANTNAPTMALADRGVDLMMNA